MAHYKRKRARTALTKVRSRGHWFRWPKWWDVIHHNRPKRRDTDRLLRLVLAEKRDPDDVVWPTGNCKPRACYW